MQQHGFDAADRVLGFRLVARPDHEAVAATADLGAGRDNVEGGAVAVGREEADRIVFGLAFLANFFGQADGSEGAVGAEPFVVGDGRPVHRIAKPAGEGDGVAKIGAGLLVDGDANRDVGGVVADASFGDWLSKRFFEQDGIGNELEAIGGPGSGGPLSGRRGCPRLCS